MGNSIFEKKLYEDWYPTALAIAFTIASYSTSYKYGIPEQLKELFGAVLNISAMGIGFLSTAVAILFSLGDSNRIRNMKIGGQFQTLVIYLISAIKAYAALAVLSAGCLMFKHFNTPFQRGILTVWIGCAFLSSFMLMRVISNLRTLLIGENNEAKSRTAQQNNRSI